MLIYDVNTNNLKFVNQPVVNLGNYTTFEDVNDLLNVLNNDI